jgi:hypothetical protein
MKVGDLICYNAAGQKYKTLGLILEFAKPAQLGFGGDYPSVLIQWCVVGKIMPRREWHSKDVLGRHNYNDKIQPGQMIWHRKGDWFEVSK